MPYTNNSIKNGGDKVMIYLLEDDNGIQNFVLYALRSSGFDAQGFETPSEFYSAMNERIPNLLLLDIMLPEEDGISILKKLRDNDNTRDLPIIMLTAKTTEFDKVTGLDSGADDYITKPFGAMELISRINALLRRTRSIVSENRLTAGDITLIPSRHEVFRGEERLILTLKEYELLAALMKNKGKVIQRDELLSKVWGYDFTGESRTLDVHIRTLRSKLGESGDIIETVRGVGYKVGDAVD